MSDVYFVRPVGQRGPVKIGCTTLIRDRIAMLSLWAPEPLEVAATHPGSYDLEQRFHAKFVSSRKHGEWFNWTPELGEVIDAINDGTFDPASLPEPVRLKGKKAQYSGGPSKAAERDPALLPDVLEFCREKNLPPSIFSRLAANDPGFLRQLTQGRRPGRRVSQRVRAFMAAYEARA